MAHIQVSTETSTYLLQAKDFVEAARRLKPGPARNELRQVAKVLRELAKLEAQSESVEDFDWPERT
jgi:nitrate reductase assembly molybdenum cofactor insertion protein NarJ